MSVSDGTIMIVEGEKGGGEDVELLLKGRGLNVSRFYSEKSDWHVKAAGVDCIVVATDGRETPGVLPLLKQIIEVDDNIPVIIVSERASLETAVLAMKEGAYDYFSRPFDDEKLCHTVLKGVKLFSLTKKVFLLESQSGWRSSFDNMVGHSAAMQEIFNLILAVAKSNATVFIVGESGTGKELVAQAIHKHSARISRAFIDINCGAIPRELLENELFGHEKGAYTGADKRYIGSCERADQGTIFLDEISEMDALLQVKLLRFLQERNFMRVGGSEPIKVDVRIIAATNRDILQEIKDGRFREDLYYRLNVVPIHIPPLRSRREDIPLLAKHFLDRYSAKNEKIFMDFSPQAMEVLMNYDWPGNVRELENIIERIVVLHNDTKVKPSHLPQVVLTNRSHSKGEGYLGEMISVQTDKQKILPLELVEKYAIEAALKRCTGNVTEAARKLKIGQATLYRKIKQYGLK